METKTLFSWNIYIYIYNIIWCFIHIRGATMENYNNNGIYWWFRSDDDNKVSYK